MTTTDVKTVQVTWGEIGDLTGRQFEGAWLSVPADRRHHFDIASFTDQNAHAMDEDFYPDDLLEGFHLLSLLDHLVNQVLFVDDPLWAGWNYGLDKVRFVSPVTTSDLLRVRGEVVSVEPRGDGYLIVLDCVLDVLGRDKPGVTAVWRVLWTKSEES